MWKDCVGDFKHFTVFHLSLSLSLSSGGCGRTGTYIAVSILIERLKTEGVVDVFQTVRKLRMQRPGLVASPVSIDSIQWELLCNSPLDATYGVLYLEVMSP